MRRWWALRRIRYELGAIDWNPDTDVLIVNTEREIGGVEAHRIREMVWLTLTQTSAPRIIPAGTLTFTVLRDKRRMERPA